MRHIKFVSRFAEVLYFILNLDVFFNTEKEKIMSQFDDLKASLDGIQAAVADMSTRIDTIILGLGGPDPDITPLLAEAQAIKDQLDAFHKPEEPPVA